MSPHLVLQLAAGASVIDAPSWIDVIRNRGGALTRLHPDLDKLLRRYGFGIWASSEYPRRALTWTPDEIASGLDRIYRLVLRENQEIPRELIHQIRMLPTVRFARMGAIGESALPTLQMGREQSRRSRVTSSREVIGLEEAHAVTRGDSSVTIAVIDTGVDLHHPEIEGSLEPGHDFVDIIDGADEFIGDFTGADPDPDDEVGHGTHVSGIIAGRGNQMPGGVAPGCRILPVRALAAMKRGEERVGAGLVDNINAAIKWAIDQGADVINMSLGVRHESGGLPHEEVVDYARRRGVTIVAASGNDGSRQLYFPGALPHVVAVGAADSSGQVASFSTYGDHVTLIAPGEDIYSSYLNGRYAFASGTSQASPFVAGAVALMKSFAKTQGRRLSDRQIKHVLKTTSDKIDTRFKHPKAGYGCLNLADALRWLEHRFADAPALQMAA